jgi:hypothetical protein
MPIADLSTLINLATNGGGQAPQSVNFHKTGLVAGAAAGTLVAGRLTDLWMYDGQPGAATATPTSAVTVNNATAGSWLQTTPTAGTDLYLVSIAACAHVAGSLILYDRLVQHGGLSATTTGAQTTNLPTPALTRFTSGVGVEAWATIYTQIGATGTTITASYTNTVPSSGQTTVATTFGNTGFREAQRVLPLPLHTGDKGVTVVASMTIAASTLTAGNFGVTLVRPLAVIPIPLGGSARLWSGVMTSGGPLDLGTVSDACLSLAWCPNTTTAPVVYGQAFFVTV